MSATRARAVPLLIITCLALIGACAAVWVSAVWFSGDFGTFWTGAMRNWYG